MTLTVDRRANRVLVRCSGALDAAAAAELETAVVPLLGEAALRHVIDCLERARTRIDPGVVASD